MAKKKVTLIYTNDNAESLLAAIYIMATYRNETLTVINMLDLDEAGISTAIGTLAANQDLAFVTNTTDCAWTSNNVTALDAKMHADGTKTIWAETATTTQKSIARLMWEHFNVGTAPEIVWLCGTPDTDLNAALTARKEYFAEGIIVKANKISSGDVVLDDTAIKFVADAMDIGLYGTVQRSAAEGKLSQPTFSRINTHDLLSLGMGYVKGSDIAEIFEDESE